MTSTLDRSYSMIGDLPEEELKWVSTLHVDRDSDLELNNLPSGITVRDASDTGRTYRQRLIDLHEALEHKVNDWRSQTSISSDS